MSDKTSEPQGKEDREAGPKERQTFGQWAWGWAKSIAIAFVIWFFLQAFLVKSFMIISDSLDPTLLVGDALFINKALYGARVPFTDMHTPVIREPRHGDLVVFEGIEEPVLTIVKRLIGLPGDTLRMSHDSLFRNGEYVPEPYVQHIDPTVHMDHAQRLRSRNWQLPHLVDTVDKENYLPDLRDWGPIVVPKDHVFGMGDNRDASYDGRHWGFLPRENLIGHPMFIYYSYDPNHWRPLPFLTAIRWRRLLRRPS